MNFVALKMLVGDRLKYIALVAGVAFAALLITQQASIFTGYMLQIGAWIRDTGSGDPWGSHPPKGEVGEFKTPTGTPPKPRPGRDGGGVGGGGVQGQAQRP